jgi:hypothetical protein
MFSKYSRNHKCDLMFRALSTVHINRVAAKVLLLQEATRICSALGSQSTNMVIFFFLDLLPWMFLISKLAAAIYGHVYLTSQGGQTAPAAAAGNSISTSIDEDSRKRRLIACQQERSRVALIAGNDFQSQGILLKEQGPGNERKSDCRRTSSEDVDTLELISVEPEQEMGVRTQ